MKMSRDILFVGKTRPQTDLETYLEEHPDLVEGGEINKYSPLNIIASLTEIMDVLGLSMAIEAQSQDLYFRMANQSEDSETKRLFLELADEEKGKDVVVLRNGDRIAGHVKEFSGGEVLVVDEGGEREVRLDRDKVWQIVFGGRSSSPVKGASVVFWDDNRLAGKVSSLKGHVLSLETQAMGELEFDVGPVKTIIFEE